MPVADWFIGSIGTPACVDFLVDLGVTEVKKLRHRARMGDTAEKGPSRSRTDEAPIKTTEAQRQSSKVVFAVAAYATCSASMLIVNKLCITYLPAPTMVLFLQLSFTALAIRTMTHAGIVDADPLDVEKAKPFVLVALAFLGALYTNVKTLQYANVETFIVFRCSTPCLIAVLDYVFLGRAMPNLKSWASLGAIVCGAVTYVSFDSDFEVRAYGWVLAWYVVFAFDQIYIKYAVDQSSLSVWGRTYYMNALAVVPVSVLGLVTGESAAVSRGGLTREDESYAWGFAGFCALTASCVAGVAMSYSAMQLRGMISATSFTVVGTMCKIATVVINCLIWDKHASFAGLAALFICLFAGLGYEQSPLRNPPPATTKPAPVGSDKV